MYRFIVPLVALLIVAPAALAAETPTLFSGSVFARTSNGDIFLIQGNQRYPVLVAPWDDERILSIPLAAPDSWASVVTFKGSDPVVTPPFTIGPRWKLIYTVGKAKYGDPQLCISAWGVQDKWSSPDFGCYHKGGESQAYQPGQFYLEIDSDEEWTVEVQELRN